MVCSLSNRIGLRWTTPPRWPDGATLLTSHPPPTPGVQILTKPYTHRLIWIKHSLDEKIKEEYARYEEVLGDLYDIHEKRNEKEEKEDTRECTIFIQKTTKSKKVNRGLYDIQKITKSKEKISRGLYDTKQRKKKSLGIVRYEKKGGEGGGAAGFVYGPRFQSLLVDT